MKRKIGLCMMVMVLALFSTLKPSATSAAEEIASETNTSEQEEVLFDEEVIDSRFPSIRSLRISSSSVRCT